MEIAECIFTQNIDADRLQIVGKIRIWRRGIAIGKSGAVVIIVNARHEHPAFGNRDLQKRKKCRRRAEAFGVGSRVDGIRSAAGEIQIETRSKSKRQAVRP